MATSPAAKAKQEEDHMRQRKGRNVYLVQLAVPSRLRPAYGGKAILEKSLGTDSVTEARLRRDNVISRWRQEFLELTVTGVITPEALSRIRQSQSADDGQTAMGLDRLRKARMRETLEYLKDKPYRDEGDIGVKLFSFDLLSDEDLAKALRAQGMDPTPNLITKAANVIYEADVGAKNLYDRGRELGPNSSEETIDSLLEVYFVEKTLRPRQVNMTRRVLSAFIDWLKSKKVSPVIGRVTKELVGRYASERYMPGIRGAKAVNNELSALSRYWQFLAKKGKATFNPFEGQSLERKLAEKEKISKRAFNTAEMVKLLNGPATPLLSDCNRLLALHAMRAEELCQLRVGDCHNGVIRVYGGGDLDKIPKWHEHSLGKNESARRDIPIHSAAVAIMKRRMKGKKDSDYLIHELTTPSNPVNERSKALGRVFGDYRKSLGVHDQVKGQTQSKVDMHSFRRWFLRAAGEALREGAKGFDHWTVADVAGHDAESRLPLGMTMSRYPGPSDMKARKACVEAVKLP